MNTDVAEKIEKIASQESILVNIYREIYPLLSKSTASELTEDDLSHFESPDEINPDKAAAILKAILGSTPQDKFQLERCHPVQMDSGQSVGGYIRDRLKEVGLSYHDFWPYLREHGWLNE